jgi:hypothetical protein
MNLWGEREQLRQVFFQAWRRHREGTPLQGVETVIVDVALAHPEYHPILDDPERNLDRDYQPEAGQGNPFAHMGMHIALREQLGLGQVAGLREAYRTEAEHLGDGHAAEHRLMDCLIEAMWSTSRGEPLESAMATCLQRLRESGKRRTG